MIFFSKYELEIEVEEWLDLSLYIGKTHLIEKNDSLALPYFDKVISKADAEKHKAFVAMAFYFKEDFVESASLFKDLVVASPENIEYRAKLAVSYYKNQDLSKANQALADLEALRKDFQYGSLDYALGQYYTMANDPENTKKHLLKSVASGNWFTNNSFQNDPHFKNIKSESYFKEILNFWH